MSKCANCNELTPDWSENNGLCLECATKHDRSDGHVCSDCFSETVTTPFQDRLDEILSDLLMAVTLAEYSVKNKLERKVITPDDGEAQMSEAINEAVEEAKQAITALCVEAVGEDKTYETATTDELKQGWHIYLTQNKLRAELRTKFTTKGEDKDNE